MCQLSGLRSPIATAENTSSLCSNPFFTNPTEDTRPCGCHMTRPFLCVQHFLLGNARELASRTMPTHQSKSGVISTLGMFATSGMIANSQMIIHTKDDHVIKGEQSSICQPSLRTEIKGIGMRCTLHASITLGQKAGLWQAQQTTHYQHTQQQHAGLKGSCQA